jgi:hypothetical protein
MYKRSFATITLILLLVFFFAFVLVASAKPPPRPPQPLYQPPVSNATATLDPRCGADAPVDGQCRYYWLTPTRTGTPGLCTFIGKGTPVCFPAGGLVNE